MVIAEPLNWAWQAAAEGHLKMNASTPILVAAAWIPVQALSEERPTHVFVASIPREPWFHGRERGMSLIRWNLLGAECR